MNSLPVVVLDSFAVLAYLQDEPASALVERLLEEALNGDSELAMSVVNLGEVAYRMIREHGEQASATAVTTVQSWPVTFYEADFAMTLEAALLKGRYAMAYADCYAAALAMRLDASIATGDPEFREVEHLIEVMWLPQPERI